MNFTFNDKQSELLYVEDGFVIPSFPKEVQYHSASHSDYRIRQRGIFVPIEFEVPFVLRNKRDTLHRDDVIEEVTNLFYSDGPNWFSLKDSKWKVYGEFTGPFEVPKRIDTFTEITLRFVSSYAYKFAKEDKIQSGSSISIKTKSQVPTVPFIELTNVNTNDLQISITGSDFYRLRLSTGSATKLPAKITIDIENEDIYETNSKVSIIKNLHIDSTFEEFKIKNGDVVVTNNGTMKITYKELML